MNFPSIDWTYSGLTPARLKQYEKRLNHEVGKMKAASKMVYSDARASINLPVDEDNLKLAKRLANKHKKAVLVVVVGIGGSNLGTWAVQEAVLGKLHNLNPGKKPQIVYADTVDPDSISNIIGLVRSTINKRRHVVVNIVSKSGGTTETISIGEYIIEYLRRMGKDPRNHVVFTTDYDSKLWNFAYDNQYDALPMPKKVGGRFSVFSTVGLFPLALAGVNIRELLEGAAHMRAQCLRETDNPAIIRAAMLADSRNDGKNIADNFYFKLDFENLGKWYRQLMGESIGKEWDAEHKQQVWMGITPTVSLGTTDLHSMAQLYFGGPHDKFHTIYTVKNWNKDIKIPKKPMYSTLVPNIQGKKFTTIMDSVVKGVIAVLKKQNRPFCVVELPDSKEFAIGALMQLQMMEIMYLGAYFGLNPFDQPNVEAYKTETKRILARRK